MCGEFISSIFGGGRRDTPQVQQPAPPTPPPAPVQPVTAPIEQPAAPPPGPISEDETKRKAKVTAKKVQKKTRAAGTTQLATKKPATGGLQGINTPQGVNVASGGGAPATPKAQTK